MNISVKFILKRLLYIEAIFLPLKRTPLAIYCLSKFIGKKIFVVKKIISLLAILLCCSDILSSFVFAQELQVSRSQSLAIGFGRNGALFNSITSSPISVLVKDDTPKFYDTDGRSLVEISPTIGVAPQVVIFDGSKLLDLMLVWDFGDGEKSTQAFATHVYKDPGKYLITLNVENTNGRSAKLEKEIEIRDKNEAPIIDATYTTNETDDYLEVIFDASMSFDIEGDPISFKWIIDNEIDKKIFAQKFTKKSTIVPKVVITDSLGAESSKFLNPIEYLGPNISPVASFTISPTECYLMAKVLLSAKGSFDKDGEIKDYLWTIFDNDSSFEFSGKEVNHEFTKAGTFKVKLVVIDDRNRSAEKEEVVRVLKPDPIASAAIDKTSGNAPLAVQFKSDGSRDFDGSLVNVRWNFGDGSSDSTEANPIHTYLKPGAYLATLQVQTSDGRIKKTNTKTILVNENSDPVAIISVLEGVRHGVSGEAMIGLSANGSFDPINNQMLTYSWSWIAHQLDKDKNLVDISEVINKQQLDANEEEFSYTFVVPGQYTPVLEVKTEDGRVGRANGETITILPGQNPVAIAKIASHKLSGIGSLTVKFDGSASYDPKPDGEILLYLWEFGDGETSSEITPEHNYTKEGEYNAKLIVQDNRGFKGTALAHTVRVDSVQEKIFARVAQLNLQVSENDLNSDSQLVSPVSFAKDEEKPEDTSPPQISLVVDNPDVKAGDTLAFVAHVIDNIGIANVGYKLVDLNNEVLLEEIEEAPGNSQIDDFMTSVDYVKEIKIPENTEEGKYKLLIFAKDKADNWLGKGDFTRCHPEQSEGSQSVSRSFANAQDDTSCQIVSSEITILQNDNPSSSQGSLIVEAEEQEDRPDAEIIKEIDDVLANQNIEERDKLIQIVTSPLAKKYLDEYVIARRVKDPTKQSPKELLRSRTVHIMIHSGTPSSYGVPSTMSIVNTVTPIVSPIMVSNSGTALVNVSVMGTVTAENIRNYSGVVIMIADSRPYIVKEINLTCGAGKDCTVTSSDLKDIQNPVVTSYGVDSFGNQITSEKKIYLDASNFNPSLQDKERIPIIDHLKVNLKEDNFITQGSGAFNLKIEGAMFNQTSYVFWNGIQLDTNYIDGMTLSAFIPAHLTQNPQSVKIIVRKYLDKKNKELDSEAKDFEVKPLENSIFELGENPITLFGDENRLLRSGGNIYVDSKTTVFKDAGSVTLTFKTNNLNSYLTEITGALVHISTIPLLKLYLDGKEIATLTSTSKCFNLNNVWNCGKNKKWVANLGELKPGIHILKLSLPDLHGDTIFVFDNIKLFTEPLPIVEKVIPNSIYPSNPNDRNIEIIGKDFGNTPKILYKGREINASLDPSNKNKIHVVLPENLEISNEERTISLNVLNTETNKSSKLFSILLREEIKVESLSANYKFDENTISGILDVMIASNVDDADKAYVGVFDSAGKVIKNPFGDGKIVRNAANPKNFNVLFALPNDLGEGAYNVLVVLERDFGDKKDYSDSYAKKFLSDLVKEEIKTQDEFNTRLSKISQNHKSIFLVPLNIVPEIILLDVHNINGVNVVQEGQEISLSVSLKGNVKDTSNLVVEVDFGNGETVNGQVGETVKYVYKINTSEKSIAPNIVARVIKEGKIIGQSRSQSLLVYKDENPVAIAKVDTENYDYQGDTPFKTAFIDKSYDPNDEITNFSGVLDKTISEKNIWKLFKYQDGISKQILNTEDLSILGNQILSGGKTFLTGNILNPGTYYAKLTVFDRASKSDSAQSETVQVTLPSQMLLVHGSFDNPNNQAFEYGSNGQVKVQFMSDVQIRGNKQPTNIIYKWDFGDSVILSTSEGSHNETLLPNPTHFYIRTDLNRDRVDYHPELTVIAIWQNGYQEAWSSKAGTVTIIDKPEFVALEIVPDVTLGDVPLTVNFMISDKSFVKNATIVSYEFYAEGVIARSEATKQSPDVSGIISSEAQSTLDELKQKPFTHTYTTKGEFNPILKVKIKESTKEYIFSSPIISTNSLIVSSIEVLDPSDNYITNQPIQTFKINSQYTNPYSEKTRLTVHLLDKNESESVTELDPNSTTQTISLSEGINSYWFELIDSSGVVQKSVARKLLLDTVNPSLELFTPGDKEVIKGDKIKIFGLAQDDHLDHVEYQIDSEAAIIILEGDTEKADDSSQVFYKELSNIVKGAHKLIVRAIDTAGNITEETFEIGVGDGVFIFDKIISLRENLNIPTFSGGLFKTKLGSPFKIQRSLWFYGDELGKNDPYSDISFFAKSSYNDLTSHITDALLGDYKEILQTHFTFSSGDIDRYSTESEIAYKSLSFNEVNPSGSLYSNAGGRNLKDPWDVGLHTIELTASVSSPSGGVYIANSNNGEISKELTRKYEIFIERPITIKTKLEPKIANLNEDTKFVCDIEVTDPITFNQIDKKLKLLFDQSKLVKPVNSQAQVTNLNIVPGSEEIDLKDPTKAKIKIEFNLRPDILPLKDEVYKLIIPIELPKDNDHPNGKKDEKIVIPIRIKGSFPAIIEYPQEGEVVTNEDEIKGKILNVANDISKFENQNVKIGISIDGNEPINIKANIDNDQIFRVGKYGQNGNDIFFSAKLNFDLHKLDSFKDLFINKEVFGLIDLYTTYTNAKDNISFNGESRSLILLDNPEVLIKQTKLKKEKDKASLRLTAKNNATLNDSDSLLVKVTPYKEGDAEITDLDEKITNQYFTFTNKDGNPKLTETRKILLPIETQKVKLEIIRSNIFLENIKDELLEEWKTTFIDKARQEEKTNRTYLVTLDNALKADCEVIDGLLNKKLTNLSEINELKKIAGCEAEEIFFTELSEEIDSIKLPFVSNATAIIPDDLLLNIMSISFSFRDTLTLKDFKQLLKDLKLLNEGNNNGYDLETQEATHEFLKIIDELRCNLTKSNQTDSNIRSQITAETLKCGISTGNYQEYILSSIKKNLPVVVLTKALTDILKGIGAQSPLVSSNLPDSLLYRALANEEALLPLPPWVKAALWLGAYIVTTSLANQKTKIDFFDQVRDSTCTRVSGTIDRRFIIGKDLNNMDRMRTNTMAGISIDSTSTFKVNLVEPLPHIGQYPGVYSTCLPEGTHNITLQFNDQNTFSMSVTVPQTSAPIFVEPFIGGVFRKYGTARTIGKVLQSKRILDSIDGDIKSTINPTGRGAYLTSLSLLPNVEASTTDIATSLRLYKEGTFESGNINSIGVLEPERASAYADIAIDTRAIFLEANNIFPLQFVVPNTFLDFGSPEEKFHGVLIDNLGGDSSNL